MSIHVPVQRRQRAGNFILSPICPGCRQHKRPGTPVCRNCLNKLPIRMHGRLQKMLKGHFVTAYEEALGILAEVERCPECLSRSRKLRELLLGKDGPCPCKNVWHTEARPGELPESKAQPAFDGGLDQG